MPVNTAALVAEGLTGLFRQRFNRASNAIVAAAPLASTDHARVQYITTDKPFGLDLRDPPGPLGPRSLHRELTRDFQDVLVNVERFDLGNIQYSRDQIGLYTATHDIDLLAVGAADLIHMGLDWHARQTVAALDTLTDAGTPISATTVAAVIDSPIRALLTQVQQAARVRPNIALIGRAVADRLATLTNTSQGFGVGVGATGNLVAKVGASSDEDLAAWFQAKLGLRLLVSDHVLTAANGTQQFIVGNRMYLLYDTPGIAAEERMSTLKTVYRPGPNSAKPNIPAERREEAALRDMLQIDVRESAAPRQVGLDVSGAINFKPHVMWPDSGLRVDVTLS
jgi:hypothetical protein